jgi:hypothetical protein
MQLVAFAMLEREATLLGDSLRRRVVGGTIETDPPQAELPSSPREHRLKGARRQAAAAPFERNHERNIGDVARGSELDGADCLPIEPTSDRKGVTSSVAPVATELPDNVGVVGVRRRSGLRDRPAKEPRCCWIFGEPANPLRHPGGTSWSARRSRRGRWTEVRATRRECRPQRARGNSETALETVVTKRIVQANGVDLCVETFGHPSDPAILLIMGAAGSMLSWEDEFCGRLADGGRFVIRYDHRDTGRSVTYEPGAPKYMFGDLVADVVGLLDALGLENAHLVGVSMGGAIAQLVGLDHPDRVASLTLIATSPGPGRPDLPAMSDEVKSRFDAPSPEPKWSDRAAVIDYIIESERSGAARSRRFDEAGKRELAGRVFDRAIISPRA